MISHNAIKYPQYKVTLMYMALLSARPSVALTSGWCALPSQRTRVMRIHTHTDINER